jgi:hypothetical protein
MANKSPLAIVKEKFGDKAKLVAAVKELTSDALWVQRTNEAKGLDHVSNAKLLRLHGTLHLVKDKFGTRERLIGAILELEKRVTDDGYKAHLGKFPVPRLYDLFQSLDKRAKALIKAAAPKVKRPPVKKVVAPRAPVVRPKPTAKAKAKAKGAPTKGKKR